MRPAEPGFAAKSAVSASLTHHSWVSMIDLGRFDDVFYVRSAMAEYRGLFKAKNCRLALRASVRLLRAELAARFQGRFAHLVTQTGIR